jgi:hypothetical protein
LLDARPYWPTPLVADVNQHLDVVYHQELLRETPTDVSYDIAPCYESAKRAGRALPAEQYLREIAAAVPAARVGFKVLLSDLDLRKDIGLERFLIESMLPRRFGRSRSTAREYLPPSPCNVVP